MILLADKLWDNFDFVFWSKIIREGLQSNTSGYMGYRDYSLYDDLWRSAFQREKNDGFKKWNMHKRVKNIWICYLIPRIFFFSNRIVLPPLPEIEDETKDFLFRMLDKNPETRITAKEMLVIYLFLQFFFLSEYYIFTFRPTHG